GPARSWPHRRDRGRAATWLPAPDTSRRRSGARSGSETAAVAPSRPTSSTAHASPEEANSFRNEFACHARPPPCPCRPDPEVGRMKRPTFLRAAAVAGALAALPVAAAAGVRGIWAVTDGEKIAHDARDHPLRARNAAWDG